MDGTSIKPKQSVLALCDKSRITTKVGKPLWCNSKTYHIHSSACPQFGRAYAPELNSFRDNFTIH